MKFKTKLVMMVLFFIACSSQAVFSANITKCVDSPAVCASHPIGDTFSDLPLPSADGTQGGNLGLTKWLTYGPLTEQATTRPNISVPSNYNDLNFDLNSNYVVYSLDNKKMFASPEPNTLFVYDKIDDYTPIQGNDSNVIRRKVAFDGDFEVTTSIDLTNAPTVIIPSNDPDAISRYMFQIAKYSCDETNNKVEMLSALTVVYGSCINTNGVPGWYISKTSDIGGSGACPYADAFMPGIEELSGINAATATITFRMTGSTLGIYVNNQTTPVKTFMYDNSAVSPGKQRLWSFAYVTNFGKATNEQEYVVLKNISGRYDALVETSCMATPVTTPPPADTCCRNPKTTSATVQADAQTADWNFQSLAQCAKANIVVQGAASYPRLCVQYQDGGSWKDILPNPAAPAGPDNMPVAAIKGAMVGGNTPYNIKLPDTVNLLGPHTIRYAFPGQKDWCPAP